MISPMSAHRNLFLLAALCLPLCAVAADKPAAKKKKSDVVVPKIDLSGIGGDLPKADGLKGKKAQGSGLTPKTSDPDVSYDVVEVVHAQDFSRGAGGARPVGGALEAITLYGKPPSTQKFSTLVRVKATKAVNTSIELVILDPRGDTMMTGSGELGFKGNEKREVDYLIDWAPTPHPKGGDFKLLVRIGGQPMGTWPLKVVADKR